MAEPASQACHHGATDVASPATQTCSPRLSTSKTGLNTILKTNETEKNLLNTNLIRMSFVLGDKLEVVSDFPEKHF